MTPEDMAALHAAAFAPDRGWTAAEIADLCASPFVDALTSPAGFALIRTVAEEAELLTLAVDPARRRSGIGTRLMQRWLSTTPAERAFLEVAADNRAAQALYARHGFAVTGRRRGYYARPGGPAVDAVLMQVAVTHRQPDETPR